MKPRNTRKTKSHSSQSKNQSDFDCSCQILYDDNLSQVNDSDCSCDQCMEANLNAFNDIIKSKQEENLRIIQNNKNNRKNFKSINNINNQNNNNKNNQIKNNKSLNYHQKNQNNNSKTAKYGKFKSPNKIIGNSNTQINYFGKWAQSNLNLQSQQLNDFMLITQNRTRQYLKQLKKQQYDRKKDKQNYKDKITHNLEMLRYTSKLIRCQNQYQNSNNSGIQWKPYQHKFKWNHSQYNCKCNGHQKHTKDQCCAYPKPDRLKKELDTNLNKIMPQFKQKRSQILQQVKTKRLQKLQPSKQNCPYDHCQKHHMRTSKTKLAQIQKFISKKANQYKEKCKKKQKQTEKQKKLKEAKLRAIDIKCKKILQKTKKRQVQDDRTSFHLTIENFDTFSELRQANQARKIQKQTAKNIKKMIKNGGGHLQKAIYEDAFQDQQDNIKLELPKGKQNTISKKAQQVEQTPYQKIMKQAKIYSPKKIKQDDQKQKLKKTLKNQKNKSLNLSKINQQQKRKKKLQEQIAAKKQQIMKEFNKRNTHATKGNNYTDSNIMSKNKQLRQQYQKNTFKNKQKKNVIQIDDRQTSKDLYRNVYKHCAGVNESQIEAAGDPLIHQYLYHQEINKKNKESYKEDRQIFSSNFNTLMSKKQLGV